MQCKIVAFIVLLLPLAAVAQDTTGQKVDHAPGKNPCACGTLSECVLQLQLQIKPAVAAVAVANLLQHGNV